MHAAALILRSGGKKALGLMGHSKAGSGVLLYSAEHGDIPRVANVSGRFDHKRGQPLTLTYSGLTWRLSTEMSGYK